MTLAIDSSVLIDFEKDDKQTVKEIKRLSATFGSLAIPSPAYSEVYFGCLNKREYLKSKMLDFLNSFEFLNTTKESSIKLAELRKISIETGKQTPLMDLLIASIVIANGATLLTHDKDFEKIKGLDVVVI